MKLKFYLKTVRVKGKREFVRDFISCNENIISTFHLVILERIWTQDYRRRILVLIVKPGSCCTGGPPPPPPPPSPPPLRWPPSLALPVASA